MTPFGWAYTHALAQQAWAWSRGTNADRVEAIQALSDLVNRAMRPYEGLRDALACVGVQTQEGPGVPGWRNVRAEEAERRQRESESRHASDSENWTNERSALRETLTNLVREAQDFEKVASSASLTEAISEARALLKRGPW